MFFSSDNWAGAHPKIAESLTRHAAGFSSAYGTGDLDHKVEHAFNDIFEREVTVFFVGTGTAANVLSLSAASRPGGVTFCHREAHLIGDEGGAPEYFTHGRLYPVDGPLARMNENELEAAINKYSSRFVHAGQPAAISITQATEAGTVYGLDQIGAISQIARRHRLPLHMDGARFANALVSLGTTPAQMTWKSGVDIVSFGGTKNGCWCAEAVIFMNPQQAKEFPFIRKRAAQLFSKSRFIAAQFDAYFENDLWLDIARHANAMAKTLADIVEASPFAQLGWQPQANAIFPFIERKKAKELENSGVAFYPWQPPHGFMDNSAESHILTRFVTSFATTQQDVDHIAQLLGS